MAKLKLIEHVVEKKTTWGTVKRSLNQHIVMIADDDGRYIQCGYVGTTAFLPLCGFPRELVADVAAQCSEILGREITGANPPPTLREAAEIVRSLKSQDDDQDEDE